MVLPSEVKKQQQLQKSKSLSKLPKPPMPPKPPMKQNKSVETRSSLCCLAKSNKQSTDKSWLRQNWCCVLRIFLAVAGIGIPLYIWLLAPCEGSIVYEKQPVDLFIVLDASGSVEDDEWILSRESAVSWVQEFDSQIPNLQVGIAQFSDDASIDHQFHPNVSKVLDTLSSLEPRARGGTFYQPALQLFLESLVDHRVTDSYVICLFLSDGEPADDGPETWSLLDTLKSQHNATMVGASIRAGDTAEEIMYRLSSCEGYENKEDCPNYVQANNFQEFADSSQDLANSVALQVGSVETKTCEPGLWWLTCLLILPLLFVLLASLCVSKTKKKRVRVGPKAPAVNDIEDPAKPQKRIPQGKKKKKFKWDTVAADNYLWNFSGGAAPMKVNYGDKAPPSAPKDLKKGRIKRGVETWEDADGWTYEEIEEEQTLEEWAEDKAKGLFSRCCWCCCCCCSAGSK